MTSTLAWTPSNFAARSTRPRFWVQACIRFSVESIRPAPLSSSQEQAYRTGVMGGGDNFPIILAHELGHSLLGLEHYEGTDVAENLMSQQIMQQRATAHGLTPEQITRARQQAASGDTFLPGP
jgi:hypothetical protein